MGLGGALRRAFGRAAPEVATHLGEHGGSAAKAENRALAHELEHDVQKSGAGLSDTHAPKSGPPKEVRTINPERVTDTATRTGQRINLQPLVRPLAIGTAATAGAIATGYAARSIGDAIFHAHEEQGPITHELPGGGYLYTDPITGETYVIVPKNGGGHHEDAGGKTPTDDGSGGYDIQTVTDGNRADAKSKEAFWENLTNPVVIVGILGVVAAIIWARSSGGGK